MSQEKDPLIQPGSFQIKSEENDITAQLKELFEHNNRIITLSADEYFEETYQNALEDEGGYINRAKTLITELGPTPDVIYYPGSNIDLSFTKVFPDARVIHVDKEEMVIDKMKRGGYEAYIADMNEFVPDDLADVVVIFNAGYIEQEQLNKVTKPNGLVVVNNYHLAATFMQNKTPDFSLAGAVLSKEPNRVIKNFNTEELGKMPKGDEVSWPPHSETIFAFQKKRS